MKFTVECSALSTALADIKKAVGVVEHCSIITTDNGLQIGATNKLSTLILNISNVSIDAKGKVTTPIDTLYGAIKNRKLMEFEFDDSVLKFRSTEGRLYSGNISTFPYETIGIEKEEMDFKLTLKSDDVAALYAAVNSVSLQGAYGDKDTLPVYLKLSKDGITALCYDNFHLAYVVDKSRDYGDDVFIALAPTLLSSIESQSKGKGFNLGISKSSIYAANKTFRLRQPLVQINTVDESEVIGNIATYIEDTMSKESTTAEVDRKDFDAILDNSYTFYAQGIPLNVRVEKKSLSLNMVGEYGNVSEKIHAASTNPKSNPFKCEISLISEILGKINLPRLHLRFVEDVCLYITAENGDKFSFYSAGLLE